MHVTGQVSDHPGGDYLVFGIWEPDKVSLLTKDNMSEE